MEKIPVYLSLDDVLLLPRRSRIKSRQEVDVSWMVAGKRRSVPVIAVNMDDVVGEEMAIAMSGLGGLAILPRFDAPEIQANKVRRVKKQGGLVAAAVGVKDDEWKRLEQLVQAGVDHISIDVAHGQMVSVIDLVKRVRKKYGRLSLSAGVVGTYEGARDLFEVGVDVVRVGVGPGTICTTRIQTGTGVPQLTAVMEAARAAREKEKQVWADGGVKNSGDIVKCLAAGASAVVVGSLLAGCSESPGKVVMRDGVKYKEYRASTSYEAKKEQVKKYGKDKGGHYVKHVEGVESLVPFKGPVEGVVDGLMAGVRSGLAYSGARKIEEFWRVRKFIRVTAMGMRENGAHDVVVQ